LEKQARRSVAVSPLHDWRARAVRGKLLVKGPSRKERMRRVFVSFAVSPVVPFAGCAPADPSLAGHYYLHGVMEVGSELLLKADGRFEYMLAYGALDELASGCWTRNGGVVTLNGQKFEASMEDPMKFTRLELTIASGGKLLRHFDPEHVGAYLRH
jgi:hypothetical protein